MILFPIRGVYTGDITFSNGYAVDYRTYTEVTTTLDKINLQSRTRINIIYRTW